MQRARRIAPEDRTTFDYVLTVDEMNYRNELDHALNLVQEASEGLLDDLRGLHLSGRSLRDEVSRRHESESRIGQEEGPGP